MGNDRESFFVRKSKVMIKLDRPGLSWKKTVQISFKHFIRVQT